MSADVGVVVHDGRASCRRRARWTDPRDRIERATRSAATTARSSSAEGLNEYRGTDITAVTPAVLSSYHVVILGEMTLTAAQATMLTNWVTAGGKLVAMRPDSQLAGLLGLTKRRRIDVERVPAGRHEPAARAGHHGPDDPVPRHRRPVPAVRCVEPRDALQRCVDRHGLPRRDAARRRDERRPGVRVHLRPRPLRRLHPPGQPGVVRSGARRATADPIRRPLLRRRGGRSRSRTG